MTVTVDPDALAVALVDALQVVVPPGLTVNLSATGPVLGIEDPGQRQTLVDLRTFAAVTRLTVADAVAAVAAVLSTLQDIVSEALTQPWPRTTAGAMALPDAAVEDGWITGRFGAPGAGLRLQLLKVDADP